jgi:hypothetical protein
MLRQYFVTRYILIAVGVLLLAAVVAAVFLAFASPELRLVVRDILLVFLFLLAIFTMLMFLALAIAIFSLVEQANGRAQPMIEHTHALIRRVRGTTEFVGDEVASPLIRVAGKTGRVRALLRTGTGEGPPPIP